MATWLQRQVHDGKIAFALTEPVDMKKLNDEIKTVKDRLLEIDALSLQEREIEERTLELLQLLLTKLNAGETLPASQTYPLSYQ